ncbi:unnamed protein product [Musa textilis]
MHEANQQPEQNGKVDTISHIHTISLLLYQRALEAEQLCYFLLLIQRPLLLMEAKVYWPKFGDPGEIKLVKTNEVVVRKLCSGPLLCSTSHPSRAPGRFTLHCGELRRTKRFTLLSRDHGDRRPLPHHVGSHGDVQEAGVACGEEASVAPKPLEANRRRQEEGWWAWRCALPPPRSQLDPLPQQQENR